MAAKKKGAPKISGRDLIERVSGFFACPDGGETTVFPHVDRAAWAFVAASLRQARNPRVTWISCTHPRERERLASELTTWGHPARTFPLLSEAVDEEGLPIDPESNAARLALIEAASLPSAPPVTIVIDPASFSEKVPSIAQLGEAAIVIEKGQKLEMNELIQMLDEAGFDREAHVFGRGQYAVRGGIIDVFAWQAELPLRIEFFDTEIDSLREFDVDSQVSVRKQKRARLVLGEPKGETRLRDVIDPDHLLIHCGNTEAPDRADAHIGTADTVAGDDEAARVISGSPFGKFDAGDFVLQDARRANVYKQIAEWLDAGWSIVITVATDGEEERFRELDDDKLLQNERVTFLRGDLANGFLFQSAKLAVLSSSEIFGRYQQSNRTRRVSAIEHRRRAVPTAVEDISEGDLVVHAEYGIGKFKGIEEGDDGLQEIAIEYRDGGILNVPIDQAHLIARYVGLGGGGPKLNKLGDGAWTKTRQQAEKAVADYAAQMLRVQAERETLPGYQHAPDGQWMSEFEHSFHFVETPDQRSAIDSAKIDMEAPRPMDRLICGDVGFGKTEVAIRAAFKCATGGKQCAFLAPTTVLAEQHWRTFRQRMSDYPLRIELLNRFKSAKESREILKGLADGSIDIVIGTHRLISKDVSYKNLGLAIIDEEQRFGVRHKERFKEMFRGIDMLTLSATPIPRTLYLSLMGARDMSTIDTAPPNRVPVRTSIQPYDERIIRSAIEREMARGGQIFFLHNRVKTIEKMREKLEELVPSARVVVGHGQMEKEELEAVMHTFVEGEADILLATTIIESGIDIPNANTIIIDRADRFGLADLYQLRGRVGRAGQQAYAILLLPPDMVTGGDARKRINAIRDYTALGSGFKIAMRDLEIRGAGNLLGTKQSGHIAAIGFDLYCQMLKQSVDRMSGKTAVSRVDVLLRADFLCFSEGLYTSEKAAEGVIPAFIPHSYMSEAKLCITAYKQLAQITKVKELREIQYSWADRFGKLPEAVSNLILATELKLAAAHARISAVEIKGSRLMLTRNGTFIQLEGSRFPRLKSLDPKDKLQEAIDLVTNI